MEDFDKLKNKLLKYESPLNIEEEWRNFSVKKENIFLRKKIKTKNIILLSTSILILMISSLFLLKTSTHKKLSGTSNQVPTVEEIVWSDKKEISSNNNPNTTKLSDTTTIDLVQFKTPQTITSTNIPTSDFIRNRENINSINTLISTDNLLSQDKKTSNNIIERNSYLSIQKIETPQSLIGKQNPFSNDNFIVKTDNKQIKSASSRIQSNVKNNGTEVASTTISNLPNVDLILIPYIGDSLDMAKLDKLKIEAIEDKKLQMDGKNYVSLELFGQGGFYSINYGRVLAMQSFGETSAQIGLSLNPKKVNGKITGTIPLLIPFSVTQSFRIKANHYILAGLGSTFVNDKLEGEPNFYYLFGNFKLGYKFQKPGSRFFVKGELLSNHAFENIFSMNSNRFEIQESSLWGGVGIGYHF